MNAAVSQMEICTSGLMLAQVRLDTLPAGLVSVDQVHKGHCKQATVRGSEPAFCLTWN